MGLLGFPFSTVIISGFLACCFEAFLKTVGNCTAQRFGCLAKSCHPLTLCPKATHFTLVDSQRVANSKIFQPVSFSCHTNLWKEMVNKDPGAPIYLFPYVISTQCAAQTHDPGVGSGTLTKPARYPTIPLFCSDSQLNRVAWSKFKTLAPLPATAQILGVFAVSPWSSHVMTFFAESLWYSQVTISCSHFLKAVILFIAFWWSSLKEIIHFVVSGCRHAFKRL